LEIWLVDERFLLHILGINSSSVTKENGEHLSSFIFMKLKNIIAEDEVRVVQHNWSFSEILN